MWPPNIYADLCFEGWTPVGDCIRLFNTQMLVDAEIIFHQDGYKVRGVLFLFKTSFVLPSINIRAFAECDEILLSYIHEQICEDLADPWQGDHSQAGQLFLCQPSTL